MKLKNLNIFKTFKQIVLKEAEKECRKKTYMIGSGQHTIFIKKDTLKNHNITAIDEKLSELSKQPKIKTRNKIIKKN